MKVRKLAAAGAAATLMFTMSACGDEAADNKASVNSQFDATQLTSANFGKAVTDSTSQAQSVHINGEMKIGDMATVTLQGDVAGTDNPKDAQANLVIGMTGPQLEQAGMSDMQIDMRMVDQAAYIKLPPQLLGMMGGSSSKPWMKMDMQDLSSTGSSMTGGAAGSMDPAQMMDALGKVGEVTNEGSKTVNGVEATHYSVVLDTQKLMEQSGQSSTSTSGMPASIPMSIYLDEQSLPVRVELESMDIQGQQLSGYIDFSDWGKTVTVDAPPADQVTEAPTGMTGS